MRSLGHAGIGLRYLTWLDGGAYLVGVTRAHDLVVWNLHDQKILHTTRVAGHQPNFVAVHPNGRQFATADYNDARCRPPSPAHLWTLGASGLSAVPLPMSADLHGGLVFTPDGTALVGGSRCHSPAPQQWVGQIVWWDLRQGRPGPGFAGHAGLTASLAFQSDGTRLVSAGGDRTVRVWDVATRQEIGKRKVKPVSALALAPDGRGLAIVHNYSGAFLLLDPSAGKTLGKPRELAGHTNRVMQVAYAPAGRWLGSVGCDGRLCLWHPDGTPGVVHSPGATPLDCLAFAPDGLRAAVGDREGGVFVCDIS